MILEDFEGFDTVRAYMDDILVITKDSFADNLKALGKFPQKIAESGLELNPEN